MIQPRPEPPKLDNIFADLADSSRDDVAFTFFKSNHVNSTDQQDRNLDGNKGSLKPPLQTELSTQTSNTPKAQTPDLDQCYHRTLQFIQMNEYLKESQDRLADQSAELQELGKTVQTQVESLRTQLS